MFHLKIIILLTITLLSSSTECYAKEKRGELFGMVVIIDPGHGGRDPGAHGTFPGPNGNVTIREAEYVYDVACRLWHMVRKYDAVSFMTTWDKSNGCLRDSRPQDHAIPSDNDEEFVLDRTRVVAGRSGLRKRTQFANSIIRKYPNHRIVFLSLHFDSTGNSKLSGVHFIAPEEKRPEIVDYLLGQFENEDRIRKLNGVNYHPVTVSGDRNHGVRRLYILSPKTNFVRQRVLIELGNFTNPDDVWRIRDFRIRENFAQLITRALFQVNELPISKARD